MGYLVTAGTAILIGLMIGWFSHRRVFTWCSRCTLPVGTVCADCRDRDRRPGMGRPADGTAQ